MNIKSDFNSSILNSYLNKIRTSKNREKSEEITEALVSWLHWLKSKERISESKFQSAMQLVNETNVAQIVKKGNPSILSIKNTIPYTYIIFTSIVLISLFLNLYLFFQLKSSTQVRVEESLGRVLPFRGTIKETDGSPLDTKRDAKFNLYSSLNSETALYSGSCLGENGIEPSFNGSFSILIGSDCGMAPIPEHVFDSNETLYLGVTIGSEPELEPRYQIFTSSFSRDTSKLQGMNPGTGTASIPFINQEGEIELENESPTLKSTNGIFTIEGGSVTITSTQENGNIIIDPALGGNVIISSGKFGVGTFNPKGTFDISGSSILNSLATFSNLAKEDAIDTSVIKLNLGTPAEGVNSEFVSFYSNFSGDSEGVKVGGIRLNNNAVAYETNGADFAEYFEVSNKKLFKTGQIVALTREGIVPARLDQNILGVVSNNAGFIGNNKMKDKSILVGMVGQVSVLVSTINGEIFVGDYVGPSNINGYGSRITDVNNKVGLSLEDSHSKYFTNEQCPISYKNIIDLNGNQIRCGIITIVINLD